MTNSLHGIIFAYRSNPDLRELTQPRNTCSVPYGGRYRVVDFMLSNFVNAGITDVGLIAHANYQSLLDHVGSGKDWDLSRKHGGLRILPPFSYADKRGDGNYHGRMDALAGVYSYLQNIRQEYVVLAGGDLAVNLPLADIFESHIQSGADVTAVCTSVLKGQPRSCDYFTADADGFATDVAVHPTEAAGLESLEVYIMSKKLLLSLVDHCAAHNISSFSHGVLQSIIHTHRIHIYQFDGYAARLQSVSGYFARSMELLDPAVRAQLFVDDRPIKTKDQSNPSTYYGPDAKSINSLVADGCVIEGEVENSILFRGVKVGKNTVIKNSIIMQDTFVGDNVTLNCVICDKNAVIKNGRYLSGHETHPFTVSKGTII